MDLNFKRQIEERMEEIPAPLAEAIRQSGWENIVFDIGRKYSLHVDDIGNIQNELILVLVGITHPDEFRSILLKELRIPEDKVDLIIDEINVKLNEKIKNTLKQTLKEVESEEKPEIKTETDIHSSERNVLKNAGIKLGDEPDEDQKVESSQNKVDNKEVSIKVAPLPDFSFEPKQESVSVSPVPDISAKLQNPQVFKGKSTSYLDPYREPVE